MSEKYGSLLYNIDELEKNLAKVRSSANQMHEERGKIVEIPHMIVGSDWLNTEKGLGFGGRLENHYPSSTYHRFDPKNEKHVETALLNAETLYPKVLARAEELHALNLPAIETNKKCRQNILDYLASYGIRRTKYIDKKNGRTTKSVEVACEWVHEIDKQTPINDNYESFVGQVKIKMEQIKTDAKNYRAEIKKIQDAENKKLAESKELAEALVLYKEQGWVTEGLSPQSILDYAEDFRRNKWTKENYPDGTPLEHSSCDFCSTWIVGEHRCECDNRRMSLCVKKNSNGEYYAYPEPN